MAALLGKGPGIMTVTLCLPATEVISIDAMASVDTVVWRFDPDPDGRPHGAIGVSMRHN